MAKLPKNDLHNLILDTLGDTAEPLSEIGKQPIEVILDDPQIQLRFYLYTLSKSDESGENRPENEYRIELRLPEHDDGDVKQAAPPRSNDWIVIFGGYNPNQEVFVFWDDDLYDTYGWVSHLQVKQRTLNTAIDDGIGLQERWGGAGGETVIAATHQSVPHAIRLRIRLTNIRSLLTDQLPADWREIPSHHTSEEVYVLENLVEYFLTNTDPTNQIATRRSRAGKQVGELTPAILDRCGVDSKSAFDNILKVVEQEWAGLPSDEVIERERRTIDAKLDEEPSLRDEEPATQPSLRDEDEIERKQYQQAVRDSAFSRSVRDAYDDTCAVCRSHRLSPAGNPEVDAAHIYPKRLNGSDDVRNGLALCKLHHWAFDSGWLSLTDDHEVIVKEEPERDGYDDFAHLEGESIRLPDDTSKQPHPLFIGAHRELNGFED